MSKLVDLSELKLKKLHPDAIIPSYANSGDVGLDISTVDCGILKPGEYGLFKYVFQDVFYCRISNQPRRL